MLKQKSSTGSFDAAGQFGTAVHQVLKNLYLPTHLHRPDLENLEAYARDFISESRYSSKQAHQHDINRCVSIARSYAQNDDPEDAEGTIAVEKFDEHTMERYGVQAFVLCAKFDRLIVRKGNKSHFVIRDYKLGKPRLYLEQVLLQLWLAKLEYPGHDIYTAEIDWIDQDGRVERDVIRPGDLQGIHGIVMTKINRLLDATSYPAEPGEACTFCPLRPVCQPSGSSDINSSADFFLGEGATE